jgi:hypothetical protein
MTDCRRDSREEALYRRSDRVVYRTIGGERLLIPLTGTSADLTRFYLLNDTAASAWELLAEPHTVASLCEALGRGYNEPAEALRADVEELLEDLGKRRLLSIEVRNG